MTYILITGQNLCDNDEFEKTAGRRFVVTEVINGIPFMKTFESSSEAMEFLCQYYSLSTTRVCKLLDLAGTADSGYSLLE